MSASASSSAVSSAASSMSASAASSFPSSSASSSSAGIMPVSSRSAHEWVNLTEEINILELSDFDLEQDQDGAKDKMEKEMEGGKEMLELNPLEMGHDESVPRSEDDRDV